MFKKLIFVLLSLFITAFPHDNVQAVEQLNYKNSNEISPSLKYQINNFLKQTYNTNISLYLIANTDLNSDGIDEYIIKRHSCDTNKNQCIHSVIAEKGSEIILLSKIMAKNIIIGETSSYGIKDILVFKNEINDYNFDIYMWSPEKKTYIIYDK